MTAEERDITLLGVQACRAANALAADAPAPTPAQLAELAVILRHPPHLHAQDDVA